VTISEVVLLAAQGWPTTSKECLILSAPLLGIGAVVVIVGAYQLVTAPIMMDRENRTQIKSLQEEVRPKGHILLDYRTVGRIVQLLVTNQGPTNNLVAQIVAAEGIASDTILPRSMRWSGWDEEARPMAEGAAYLLNVGTLNTTYRNYSETNDEGLRNYYECDSTIQPFSSSYTDIKRRPASQRHERWDEVPAIADEFPRVASLLVEIRAVNPHYGTSAWIHLGFTGNSVPIVEIELKQLEEHNDGHSLEMPTREPER
jgi:hypothetical protein